MPGKLSLNQCRGIIYRYFLNAGWLPVGTPKRTWPSVSMQDLQMDDPPLPGDPHLQKRRIALDLQNFFFVALGAVIPSPLERLRAANFTLGELAQWCFENQKE